MLSRKGWYGCRLSLQTIGVYGNQDQLIMVESILAPAWLEWNPCSDTSHFWIRLDESAIESGPNL